MNRPNLIDPAQRRVRAVGARIACSPLAQRLLPKARAWSRPLVRLLLGVIGWLPVTWLAIVAVPILLWLIDSLGVERNDRIVLTVGLSGLAVTALCMLVVLATAVWIRFRRQGPAPLTLQVSAGAPFRTGYRPASFRWNPLIRVELSWERPARADVRVVFDRDGRHEEVVAHERGMFTEVVRKYVITDVLGLARSTVRRRSLQTISIKPACGPAPRLGLVAQTVGGEQQPHPDGKPEGDLIEMRRYVPGDPLKLVLWKVYARTGRMLVRMPERTHSPFRKTLAYLVAANGDEPAAGICRSAIEGGALGGDFVFGADGTDGSTGTAREAIDRVIRSVAAREAATTGLGDFLARGAAQGVTACILFVPGKPGAWLDRVAQAIAGHRGKCRVIVGTEDMPAAKAGASRPRLHSFLCKAPIQQTNGLNDRQHVCNRLAGCGAEVVIVNRANGDIRSAGVFEAAMS